MAQPIAGRDATRGAPAPRKFYQHLYVQVLVAVAAGILLGHVWPVYFGFRGGKGAGTAVGAVLILPASAIGRSRDAQ